MGEPELKAFLFADVEGSSWAVEVDPEAAGPLEDALNTMVAIGEAHGGTVVDRTGDGRFLWFPGVAWAVQASIEMQRALAMAPQLRTGPIAVRIGIHAAPFDGSLTDATLHRDINRSSRVMSAGHGGQIIVSAAARAAVDGSLPDDVELRLLGLFRLRGVQAPQELFQVVAEGLREQFPRPEAILVPVNDLFGEFGSRLAEIFDDYRSQLADVVGAEDAKAFVLQTAFQAHERAVRVSSGDPSGPIPAGAIFVGPSGSGKSLLSRILAGLLWSSGHLGTSQIRVTDATLLSQAPTNVAGYLLDVKGQVLELRGLDRLTSTEGAAALASHLQQFRQRVGRAPVRGEQLFVVGFAHSQAAVDRLFADHPELERYLPVVRFPGLSDDELVEVFLRNARGAGYQVHADVETELRRVIASLPADRKDARRIGDLLEQVVFEQEKRTATLRSSGTADPAVLCTITAGDLPEPAPAVALPSWTEELDRLVGLEAVKRELEHVVRLAELDERRRETGPSAGGQRQRWNYAFVGNPGTGKTTVARLLGRVYRDAGLLDSGHVVEVGRKDLVAEFTGQTAPRVAKVVEQAIGGVLFVDEAHGLVTDASDSFGREALTTLVDLMEDRRGELVVVLAGYTDAMQRLLDADAGLQSRITRIVHFDDYSDSELAELVARLADERGMRLADGVRPTVEAVLGRRRSDPAFGNARAAQELFERARSRQAARLHGAGASLDAISDDELHTLVADDFLDDPSARPAVAAGDDRAQQAMARLDSLIGLADVKEEVSELAALARTNRVRRERGLRADGMTMHMVFAGAPGTGKTTAAGLVADVLHGHGVIRTNRLVTVTRADIVGEYIGHTATRVREKVREALGGVLFVDEAYSLVQGDDGRDFGREAVNELVAAMEEHRDDLVVILAGYAAPIDRLLDSNEGLRSRIGFHMRFADYAPDELVRILHQMASEQDLDVGPDAEERARGALSAAACQPGFGNARAVRALLEQARRRQARRLVDVADPTDEELRLLVADDFGEPVADAPAESVGLYL